MFLDFLLDLDKEQVYIGYSMDEVSKIVNTLNEHRIKYTHKLTNNIKSNERFDFGRIGNNKNYETQYTISVKKGDYEEAKYLVNKVLHP